jgi:integrase
VDVKAAPQGATVAPEVEASKIRTLRDLMETWVPAQEDRADVSQAWKTCAKLSGKRLCATIGDVAVDRIDKLVMDRYRDRTLRTPTNPKGKASATVRRDLKMLRVAWAWARELKFVPKEELPHARVKVVPERFGRTPTREEVLKILDKLDGWSRLATLLLFGTGARLGEIARLTWADLDLDAATVTIKQGKTGRRTVPIHAELVEALEAWGVGEPNEGIFRVSHKVVWSHLGGKHLKAACIKAEVERFTPHGLRRAAVDAFLRGGVDVGTAAAFFGHSPQVMLEHYRRATLDDHRAALLATRLGQTRSGDVVPFPGARAQG